MSTASASDTLTKELCTRKTPKKAWESTRPHSVLNNIHDQIRNHLFPKAQTKTQVSSQSGIKQEIPNNLVSTAESVHREIVESQESAQKVDYDPRQKVDSCFNDSVLSSEKTSISPEILLVSSFISPEHEKEVSLNSHDFAQKAQSRRCLGALSSTASARNENYQIQTLSAESNHVGSGNQTFSVRGSPDINNSEMVETLQAHTLENGTDTMEN